MPSVLHSFRRRLPSPRFYAWAFVATLFAVRIMTAGQGRATHSFADAPLVAGPCEVIAVRSGDTLTIRQAHLRVPVTARLLSTQAASIAKDGAAFAHRARDFTQAFVSQGEVRITFDNHRLTRAGEYLVYVDVGERRLNHALLEAGLARFVRFPGNSASQDRLMSEAQGVAERQQVGIWAVP